LYLIGKLPIESIPYCFEQADALLVSLKSEEIFALTVPAKIQTYLAFGKPVLAMINGEGAQIIDESKSGFSVSAGNYTNLAQKAIEMSEMSSVKLDEMSSSGRDYYNKRFNRENLIDFVINEFELKIRVK
jgi:glycosyltransferase involved in cell wall biosynthesis